MRTITVHLTPNEIDAFVLGGDRLQLITDILAASAKANMLLSYNLGVSGAMRWPLSFRPEVLVSTTVEII